MATQTQIIRNFGGQIIGRIEVESNGNKVVKDFYGRILGRYDAKSDTTRDFYGKIIARGDACAMLLNK